jgi:hypothetical protein
MRRNGPNILSHLALGNDGPHLSIDDNYVADFAIGNRGARLCKVSAKGRSEPNSAACAPATTLIRISCREQPPAPSSNPAVRCSPSGGWLKGCSGWPKTDPSSDKNTPRALAID